VGVEVAGGVGVSVGLKVGDELGVGVGEEVGLKVGEGLGVWVAEEVGLRVEVACGVGVPVEVGVFVAVWLGVGVGEKVVVPVGVGVPGVPLGRGVLVAVLDPPPLFPGVVGALLPGQPLRRVERTNIGKRIKRPGAAIEVILD
jgi:hypothetical protein